MSNKEIYNYVESRDCCIMMGVQVTDTVSGNPLFFILRIYT